MINLLKPSTSYSLSKLQLGDLFFNTDNLEVNCLFNNARLLGKHYPCQDEIRKAVLVDATEFANNIGQEDNKELIDWLVTQYIERC